MTLEVKEIPENNFKKKKRQRCELRKNSKKEEAIGKEETGKIITKERERVRNY